MIGSDQEFGLVVSINNGLSNSTNDPTTLFFMILSTLEFGLDNDDENVCRESLVALGALATAELRRQKTNAKNEGTANVSPLLMESTQIVESFVSNSDAEDVLLSGGASKPTTADNLIQLQLSPLGKCLRIVWRRLHFVDASGGEKNSAIVDEAADALLPLLQVENACFASLGEETFEAAEKKNSRGAVVHDALMQLTTARGLNAEVDRMNKRRFRRNLTEFVERVRAVVRSK